MTYSQLFLNLRGKIPPENHCFRPVFELRHSLSRGRDFNPHESLKSSKFKPLILIFKNPIRLLWGGVPKQGRSLLMPLPSLTPPPFSCKKFHFFNPRCVLMKVLNKKLPSALRLTGTISTIPENDTLLCPRPRVTPVS